MKLFRLPLIILLLASSLAAEAQISEGQIAQRYAFPFNGTWCWHPDGFRNGTLRYNGRTYTGVELNIDARLHTLQYKNPESQLVYLLDPKKVESLEISGDHFQWADGTGALAEGWYQILHEGSESLYKRIDRKLEENMTLPSSRTLGYDDPDFKENVFTYFSSVTTYWHIDKSGKARKIRSKDKAERILARLKAQDRSTGSMAFAPKIPQPRKKTAKNMFSSRWFEAGHDTAGSSLSQNDTTHSIVTYQNKVYEIGSGNNRQVRAAVSGMITDLKNGSPIEGIAVYDSTRTYWTTSGKDGRYFLNLPVGRHLLHFGGTMSWQEADIEIVLRGNGSLDIALAEKSISLEGARISAESIQQHRNAFIGIEKIQLERLQHIPAAFGEADVIKAVLLMPGVQSVGEASSGFNVRGGSVDQNLILFNEGTVYSPNHMFGIFSSFNSDVVKEAELYKSSIPAEYGGRISSVLDVHSREGNTERIKGSLGIGMLTSHACIDGPLGNENTTFILGGRTTYSNWILGLIPDDSYYHGSRANFYDLNAGLTHRIGESDKLSISAYSANDKFAFGRDTSFRYGNVNLAFGWQHRRDEGHSLDFSAGFDRYANSTQGSLNSENTGFILNSTISQGFAKLKLSSRSGNHTISYGVDIHYLSLRPGSITPSNDSSFIVARSLDVQNALEPAVFIGDAWEVTDKLLFDGGLRIGAFYALASKSFYFMPEIRFSTRYSVLENLSLKAGFNTMRQNIHLITNTSSISPMDTWTLVSDRIKPQDGYQAAAGIYWTLPKLSVDLSAEAYYKQSWRTLDYVSGATLSMNENLADDLLETKSRSYGVELMARRNSGLLNGWVSYVYSRSFLQEMHDYGDRSINHGKPYRAPHDKPHNLKVAANYEFTHRYSLSANLDWSTGRPVTVPVGSFEYGFKQRLAYSERNEHRIPDYFRLDLAFNVEPGHYLKQRVHATLTFGCYNVTGRKNAYSVFYTVEEDRSGQSRISGHMLSVFATQIPYATLKLKF